MVGTAFSNSRVGFALKVKYFMVLRRTMLTTVTLSIMLALSSTDKQRDKDMEYLYLQKTNTEHRQDTQLLLQGQMQVPNSRQREQKYRYISKHVETWVCPALREHARALTNMFTIPVCPTEAYGPALEYTSPKQAENSSWAQGKSDLDVSSHDVVRKETKIE